jgi:hypothetical protein
MKVDIYKALERALVAEFPVIELLHVFQAMHLLKLMTIKDLTVILDDYGYEGGRTVVTHVTSALILLEAMDSGDFE